MKETSWVLAEVNKVIRLRQAGKEDLPKKVATEQRTKQQQGQPDSTQWLEQGRLQSRFKRLTGNSAGSQAETVLR